MRTSWPHAYLLTYRTYGTWLHGDARGSHHRRRARGYRAPLVAPSAAWQATEQRLMTRPAVLLDARARSIVETTVQQVCEHRGWMLHAVHARTNHVHAVVTAGRAPEDILGAIKAWSTRRLLEAGVFASGTPIWSHHGSTLYLWTQSSLERGVDYVVHGQGADLT
jgi:REP element-mobilizing transposase RayT